MQKNIAHERKASIVAHVTKAQKFALEQLVRDWRINTALIGRRLIQYLLSGKTTLPELLQKYHAEPRGRSIKSGPVEVRCSRICIRVSQEEKQNLIVLAEEGFYLPGEVARILMELFIAGIIKKSDIWA